MPNTTTYGWPYPAGTDAPDVPYWLQQLASAIEGTVSGGSGTVQPYVMVERTTSMTLTNATATLVPWSSDADDNGSMWEGTTNPSRITFTTGGRYRGMVLVTFEPNATSYRRVQIRKNAGGSSAGGVNVATFTQNAVGTGSTSVLAIFDQRFVAGDYIEVFATQASGGNLAIGVTPGENWASVERILA